MPKRFFLLAPDNLGCEAFVKLRAMKFLALNPQCQVKLDNAIAFN